MLPNDRVVLGKCHNCKGIRGFRFDSQSATWICLRCGEVGDNNVAPVWSKS